MSPRVSIFEGELRFVSECVSDYPKLETGGDFFGFWSREGNPIIQFAIGPGKGTSRSATSFFQDIDYLRECGSLLHSSFGLEHIGAWHSHHHLGLLEPSGGDVRTMRNTIRSQQTSRFLIAICNIEHRSSASIGFYLFSREFDTDYLPCEVAILPGASPVRFHLENRINHPIVHRRESSGPPAEIAIRSPKPLTAAARERAVEKPQFAEGSFWSQREGQRYLKRVYDRLEETIALRPVEIKQLADGRPAICFGYQGAEYEIRFPNEFPSEMPSVYAARESREERRSWGSRRRASREEQTEDVQRLLSQLNLFEDNRRVLIREN